MGSGGKRIEAVVEKGPNYVFHLLAVARAGFDSDYAGRYRGSVKGADLRILEENRGRLSFLDGHTGDLSPLAVFLPAYLNLDCAARLEEYFGLLDRAFAGGDYEPFLRRYAEALARTADWWETVDRAWLERQGSGAGVPEGLRTLAPVYVGNFAAYESRVWPAERPGLEAAAAKLNAYFAGSEIITRWEELTGLTFKADVYQIILVSAIKNGPNANSLGYDRNVFYSGSDFEWMTQFISHETGTHILIGMLKEFIRPAVSGARGPEAGGAEAGGPEAAGPTAVYGFDLIYRAYENLARFYNTLVLGTADIYAMPDHYGGPEFYAIYRRLYEENPGLSPRELLARGLEAVSRRRWTTTRQR